jgi:hypothetical protein
LPSYRSGVKAVTAVGTGTATPEDPRKNEVGGQALVGQIGCRAILRHSGLSDAGNSSKLAASRSESHVFLPDSDGTEQPSASRTPTMPRVQPLLFASLALGILSFLFLISFFIATIVTGEFLSGTLWYALATYRVPSSVGLM